MSEYDNHLIDWLLEGDVSIRYQVHRDLFDTIKPELRDRIAKEGWGPMFLSRRNENGHWGRSFYQPKWTSTHYTLLDLKNLGISPDNAVIKRTIDLIHVLHLIALVEGDKMVRIRRAMIGIRGS
jgi:hypothetical protein